MTSCDRVSLSDYFWEGRGGGGLRRVIRLLQIILPIMCLKVFIMYIKGETKIIEGVLIKNQPFKQ